MIRVDLRESVTTDVQSAQVGQLLHDVGKRELQVVQTDVEML